MEDLHNQNMRDLHDENPSKIKQQANTLYSKITNFLNNLYSPNLSPEQKARISALFDTVIPANSPHSSDPLDLALYHALHNPPKTLNLKIPRSVSEFIVPDDISAFFGAGNHTGNTENCNGNTYSPFFSAHFPSTPDISSLLIFASHHLDQFVQLHTSLPFLPHGYSPQFAVLALKKSSSPKHFVFFQLYDSPAFASVLLTHNSRVLTLMLHTSLPQFLTVLAVQEQLHRLFLIRRKFWSLSERNFWSGGNLGILPRRAMRIKTIPPTIKTRRFSLLKH